MRMARWTGFAVTVLIAVSAGARAHAGCNIIPASDTLSTAVFHGMRGALSAPFLIPLDTLQISRRSCDGAATLADPADARVVVMLHPPVGRERAFVLVKNGVDCDTDAFATKCNEALEPNGVATCVALDKLSLEDGILEIDLPKPDAAENRATVGPAVVAVATKDQAGDKICAALKNRSDPCGDALEAEANLHACVHRFLEEPPSEDTCGTKRVTDFPGPTLLPAATLSYEACAQEKGNLDFCADPGATASEHHYAADADGSLLVPMDWTQSRKACSCGKFRVAAAFIPPGDNLTFDIPDNKPTQPSRNFWLQSYDFKGYQNDPEFAVADSPETRVRAFWGTDEEDKSVLRFESRLTKCADGSEDFCADGSRHVCKNAPACNKHCKNDHAKACTANTGPNGCGGQSCGKVFDFTQAMIDGDWRLRRRTQPRLFCQDDFTPCSTDADCTTGVPCVSYVIALGECDCTDTKVPPPPVPPAAVSPLAGAFDVDEDDVMASATSADGTWIAAIMPTAAARKRTTLPARCRNAAGSAVVAVAQTRQCGVAASCAVDCPDLGAGALRPRLTIVGSQVRVLQDRAAAAPARTNRFSRFFRSLFGGDDGGSAADANALATLRLIDARDVGRVTTIPNVVPPDQVYDPLTVSQQSGVTRFRVQAGRCVTEGRTLGIPSVCRPERVGECPPWATCQPDDVTVVADLTIDVDDDGIPDRLGDVVPVGRGRTRARP